MDKKFLIVLLVAVFYNGVINSSPVKEITSELITKEKQDVTPVASNQTSKVEPTTMPVSENKTHDEVATVKSTASVIDTKTVVNSSTVVNATGKGLSVQNETQTVASKNATVAASTVSNVTSPAVSPVASPVVSPAASPVPVTVKPSPVPESKPNTTATTAAIAPSTEMPRPVASNQSSTTVTTVSAGTTTVAPVTKPILVTTTPSAEIKNNTKSDGGVTVEHNSASQSQGSRFDGASFVGGIVLTVGLTAIGFIAFKYYKSGRIDGNYRTL